jgi:hypothetical protein
MRNTTFLTLAFLAAATGCGSDDDGVTPRADAAASDAAIPDAAIPDATIPDATIADATSADASADASGELPCDQELACPTPARNRFMICGRVHDFGTSQPIVDGSASALKVSFHDALALANNPETAPEFSVTPDSCGRFVSRDATHEGVTVPGTQFFAVVVDDATPAFPAGDFVATAGLVSGGTGGMKAGFHAFATHETTAAAWSTGLSPTLVEQGVYAAIFIDTARPPVGIFHGTPAAGLKLTVDGSVTPARDFYFDDSSNLERLQVGTADATGANGTALVVPPANSVLQEFGGPAGCTWPTALGTTMANMIVVSEREGTCP